MAKQTITLNQEEWNLMLDAFVEYYGKPEGKQEEAYNKLYDRFASEVNFFDDEAIGTEYTIIF